MPRIIPLEINTILRREYRMRFFTTLFFSISIAILVSLFLSSSSYLLLSLYEKAYFTQDSEEEGEEITKLNETFNTKVLQVHGLATKIPSKDITADIHISDLLFQYSNASIQISAVEILPEAEVSHVTIRGNADTRDALLQFRDKINQDTSFKDFSIPIEILTKQKDISFDINFIYHEN